MTAQEIINKYLESEKAEELLKDLKENNVHFASEENLDIRYGKLKTDMDEKTKLYEEAQKHIDELNQGLKSGEDLKAKQSEYEQRIQQLEAENRTIKIQSELKQALIQAKATDLDYLSFKIENQLKADNKSLELDDNGNIKGLDEVIENAKKNNASFFETKAATKEVDVKEIGKGDNSVVAEPKNLLDALKQNYELKQE
jgi:hypothetical protein